MDKDLRDAVRESLGRLGLVPLDLLEGAERDFDARPGGLPRPHDLSLPGDPLAGRALKFYLLLTETPGLIDGQGLTAEQVFWSRCYWFLLFTRLRKASAGYDAGPEQQAFQLLEHPPPDCELDWSMIEQVEAAVNQDTAFLGEWS